MPRESHRRKVKQHREEKVAELSAGPHRGKEAALGRGGVTASDGRQRLLHYRTDRSLTPTSGPAPQKKAGGRGSRVWESE